MRSVKNMPVLSIALDSESFVFRYEDGIAFATCCVDDQSALLKLQECFDPIADGRSGGDLIPLMVYRYAYLQAY